MVRRRMNYPVGEVTPLSIVYRNVDELTPLPNNARKHSRNQIKQIAKSIAAFGFNVPFLIDGNLHLIAGHGRLAASQVLGIRQVPTIRIDHLDESQMRAFMIAENRIAENATWNRTILAEHMKALSEVDLDFNLETTGFEMKEIDLMVAGLTPSAVDRDHSDEVLANSEIRNPVSRSGDLWRLRDHCLVCRDPSGARNYSSLLANATRAGTLITTIPTAKRSTKLYDSFPAYAAGKSCYNREREKKTITKLEVSLKQFVNQAASSDLRAVSQVAAMAISAEQSAK